jgi:hypothetical protein
MAGTPTSSRARVIRFVTAGALVAVLSACGGNGATSGKTAGSAAVPSGDTPVVVAASAGRTTATKNARLDVTGSISAAGRTSDLTSTGTVDFAHRTAQLTRIMPPIGEIEARLVDSTIYVHVPSTVAARFGGKPWLKIDANTLGTGGNSTPFGSLGTSNPTQLLSTLKGASTVTKVGDENVRGVHTVHYAVQVDIHKAAETSGLSAAEKQRLLQALGGQTTLPEDVWLDDQGLVRRLATDITATPATGANSAPVTAKTKLAMEFYDYGQATKPVEVPPADATTDFSQLLGLFGSLGSGTSS